MHEEVDRAYRYPVARVLEVLQTTASSGLSTSEAHIRLQTYGANLLEEQPPVPRWRKFLRQFTSPLTLLLIAATGVSLVAWFYERETAVPYEALTIFLIVAFNAVLGYVQEERSQQAIAALKALSTPSATVIRDARQQTIPVPQLVPGDVLAIEEGTLVAADARLIDAIDLQVTEAALTGESEPVVKTIAPLDASDSALGDRTNMVYSGTAIAHGRGLAVITATGMRTEIGKVAHLLQDSKAPETPFEKELRILGRNLGIAVILIAVVICSVVLLLQPARSVSALMDVLLLGVSLAVAAVPEGLPAITTIVLSLGVQRMARRNVIVRKLAAVETLGSATVIATDKTGTLTRNQMTVRTLITATGRVDFDDGRRDPRSPLSVDAGQALRIAAMANNASLQTEPDGNHKAHGDPTEIALLSVARNAGLSRETLGTDCVRLREIPFSADRKMMTTIHRCDHTGGNLIVASKGAPDVLLTRCDHESVDGEARPLTPARRIEIQATVDRLAGSALRTMGLAARTLPAGEGLENPPEVLEQHFIWAGLIGMHDPPRPEAKRSVELAGSAGIRVLMITGDHPRTAVAIAAEIGILQPGTHAITGAEIENLSDVELQRRVRDVSVYARVSPEHKLRIVQALRRNGEVVAMTGDGVNDAPALKIADIGIAMGIAGTDVAKGAAGMVLTDDNFASIVAAVEEGRAIFSNVEKFLRYLLSSNIGELLTMFFGVLLTGFLGLTSGSTHAMVLPLLVTQILWINLLTDSGPALALGVDPVDPSVMRDRPRKAGSRLIDSRMWFGVLLVAACMAAGTLLTLDLALPGGLIPGNGNQAYARTMAFTTLVIFQLFNVLNARSECLSAFHRLFKNGWILVAILLSAVLQVSAVHVPFLQVALGTVALRPADWLISVAVASSVLWMCEFGKFICRIRHNQDR